MISNFKGVKANKISGSIIKLQDKPILFVSIHRLMITFKTLASEVSDSFIVGYKAINTFM